VAEITVTINDELYEFLKERAEANKETTFDQLVEKMLLDGLAFGIISAALESIGMSINDLLVQIALAQTAEQEGLFDEEGNVNVNDGDGDFALKSLITDQAGNNSGTSGN